MSIPHRYVFYKGKAALQVEISRPTESKPGVVFLSIARAIKARKYDWEKKIIMAITSLEIAKLEIARLKGEKTSFFHDPGMGSEEEGKQYKNFIMERGRDGKSWFLAFTWKRGEQDPYRISIVLSDSEYYVLKQFLDRSIPPVLGW